MLQQDTCRGQILDANSVCLCLGSPSGPTPNYTTEYAEAVCGSRSLYVESKRKLQVYLTLSNAFIYSALGVIFQDGV